MVQAQWFRIDDHPPAAATPVLGWDVYHGRYHLVIWDGVSRADGRHPLLRPVDDSVSDVFFEWWCALPPKPPLAKGSP